MPTNVKLKRSAVPGKVPDSLEFGELALNYYDGKIYYKNTSGNIAEFSSGQGGEAKGTASIGLRSGGSVIVQFTLFLSICFKYDPETFRNDLPIVYDRNNNEIHVLTA